MIPKKPPHGDVFYCGFFCYYGAMKHGATTDEVRRKQIWKAIGPTLLRRYKRTETFLNFTNEWELLVAVILSAQMTDEGVNKITPALFKKYPTAEMLARAPLQRIERLINGVNYYKVKSAYIKKTAAIVVNRYQGKVPDTVEALMSLPGVGRKTAVAVLANGFNTFVGIPVDTHVIRFAKRFQLTSNNDATKIEQDLLRSIPPKYWNAAGYAIKEYGRKEGRARGYRKDSDPLWHAFSRALIE